MSEYVPPEAADSRLADAAQKIASLIVRLRVPALYPGGRYDVVPADGSAFRAPLLLHAAPEGQSQTRSLTFDMPEAVRRDYPLPSEQAGMHRSPLRLSVSSDAAVTVRAYSGSEAQFPDWRVTDTWPEASNQALTRIQDRYDRTSGLWVLTRKTTVDVSQPKGSQLQAGMAGELERAATAFESGAMVVPVEAF